MDIDKDDIFIILIETAIEFLNFSTELFDLIACSLTWNIVICQCSLKSFVKNQISKITNFSFIILILL